MSIQFDCVCGRKLNAPDEAGGRRGRCPACKEIFTVPTPVDEIPELTDYSPAAVGAPADNFSEPDDFDQGEIPLVDAPPRVMVARSVSRSLYAPPMASPSAIGAARVAPRKVLPLETADTGRPFHYLLLLLVLIPLAWSTIHKGADEDLTPEDRLIATVKGHPDVIAKMKELPENPSDAEVFALLPNNRLAGAFLAKETWSHWGLAAISGVGFLIAVMLLFPLGHAKPHQLAGIALFTGTLGILLLLVFQWLAFHMPAFTPRGWITLLLDLVWLIGQSYRMALGDHGFFLSFLGFTAGVGFCEEVCKAIPLVLKSRSTGYSSWRSAMLWGLISGVGFGVSEGITYCSDYYNGISGPGIYAVRFISCVGLHAIWAAAVGITIFRRQDFLRESGHPLEWIFRMAAIVIVPMTLHGAYDTLLKQKYDLYALGVAVLSFGWLAFQIETAKRQYDGTELGAATA